MSRKHFSALAIAVGVVLVAVMALLPSRTGHDADPATSAWLPELAAGINEVDTLRVTTAGDETVASLSRGDTQWTIAELGGYPADWNKVRTLLAALAKARVLEEKTSNPQWYSRLGVEDLSSAEATGVLLTLSLDGQEHGVIIGDAADQRSGRYLRSAGAEQSVLADFEAEVPRTAMGWADTQVADLPAANVAEVEIIHPDRDRILVRKVSADDTDYVLDNLPAGRELQSSWSANALGGILAALSMDGVRRADTLDWTQPLLVRVLTFDGMEVRVEAITEAVADDTATVTPETATAEEGEAAQTHWLRFSSSAPFAAVQDAVPEEEDVQARVAAFNARVDGWAYTVPGYKFDAMNKRLADLLKPLSDDSGAGQ
jgi:hypothetical protein